MILALGRRGTPRRLGVPGEDRGQGLLRRRRDGGVPRAPRPGGRRRRQRARVGGRACRNQPGTTVALSYRKGDFSRAKDRNVAKLEEAERAGTPHACCARARSRAIRPGEVDLLVDGAPRTLPADDVIVRIGGEPPTTFLGRGRALRHEGDPDRGGARPCCVVGRRDALRAARPVAPPRLAAAAPPSRSGRPPRGRQLSPGPLSEAARAAGGREEVPDVPRHRREGARRAVPRVPPRDRVADRGRARLPRRAAAGRVRRLPPRPRRARLRAHRVAGRGA